MRSSESALEIRTTLPRGRHALTREEVTASQRSRLLRAMIDEVAERGFAATTAAGVYQRAGVSSRAFYENFSDVGDCFLAAYDESVRLTEAAVRMEGRQGMRSDASDPASIFGAVVDTYLHLLVSEPAVAQTFLLEVYGAGPRARQRRVAVHDQFVAGVREIIAPGRRLSADDEFAIESLVDAITFRVTRSLITDDFGELTMLRDQLVRLAVRLCPWLDSKG